MEAQIGYLGATQQTWRGNPVRAAVLRLRSEHPHASEKEINDLLAQLARDDDDLLIELAQWCGTAAQNALKLQEQRERTRAMPQRREAQRAQMRQAVESIKSQILLLNLEMPNGKRMRYCTGSEMDQFGQAYRKIARKVGKTKTVGSVLSEKQVRVLMD